MYVKFNNPEEFIEEMKARLPDNPHPVRVTNRFSAWREISKVHNVTVVATYRRGDIIVLLEKYCGADWSSGSEEDEKVHARAEDVQRRVREAAQAMGLGIAAGVYEA